MWVTCASNNTWNFYVLSLSFVYLLIANETKAPRKKCARELLLVATSSTCKMQNGVCCIKKQFQRSQGAHASTPLYILFRSTQRGKRARARGFLKQRHRPLWFMPWLSRSFLIPASYMNNLSCNRPSESKTNGIAFGKLLARKTYRSFYFCFKNSAQRDTSFIYQCSIRSCCSRHPLWYIIIPRKKKWQILQIKSMRTENFEVNEISRECIAIQNLDIPYACM